MRRIPMADEVKIIRKKFKFRLNIFFYSQSFYFSGWNEDRKERREMESVIYICIYFFFYNHSFQFQWLPNTFDVVSNLNYAQEKNLVHTKKSVFIYLIF